MRTRLARGAVSFPAVLGVLGARSGSIPCDLVCSGELVFVEESEKEKLCVTDVRERAVSPSLCFNILQFS